MNTQMKAEDYAVYETVIGFSKAKGFRIKGRDVNGYTLTDGVTVMAVIETLYPMPRIEDLLTHYSAAGVFNARELMRTLLNSEDYRSPIYDAIVRIHYREDF